MLIEFDAPVARMQPSDFGNADLVVTHDGYVLKDRHGATGRYMPPEEVRARADRPGCIVYSVRGNSWLSADSDMTGNEPPDATVDHGWFWYKLVSPWDPQAGSWWIATLLLTLSVIATPFGYIEANVLALAGIGFALLGRK